MATEAQDLHVPLVREGSGGCGAVLRLHLSRLARGPRHRDAERIAERAAGLGEGGDFTLFGQPFQAMTAGTHHDFNDAISIVVSCDDQKELDRYWDALLKGGGKPQACGWLNDRTGCGGRSSPRP